MMHWNKRLTALLLALLMACVSLCALAEEPVFIPDPENLLEDPNAGDGQIDAEEWLDNTVEQAEVVDEMYTINDFGWESRPPSLTSRQGSESLLLDPQNCFHLDPVLPRGHFHSCLRTSPDWP